MDNNGIAIVTGASGFVGSHLVEKLLDLNFHVRVLARKESQLQWLKEKPLEIVRCEYNDIDCLANAIKDVNYIFHVAGVIKAKKKDLYYKGNVETTKNLLIASQNAKKLKRFVLVSSQAAAGPSSIRYPKTEEMDCYPVTTYGKSKLQAEEEVKKYEGKIPFTIVRPSAVYGPRDPETLIFFKSIKNGLQPMIGFQEKYVSLVHVSDLIEGIMLAAQSDKSIGQTYFISSERGYSWREVGDITAKILGKRVIRIKIPHLIVYLVAGFSQAINYFQNDATILNFEKANEIVEQWVCSVEKAKRELGYSQKIDLEKGIRQTLEWYMKNNWL